MNPARLDNPPPDNELFLFGAVSAIRRAFYDEDNNWQPFPFRHSSDPAYRDAQFASLERVLPIEDLGSNPSAMLSNLNDIGFIQAAQFRQGTSANVYLGKRTDGTHYALRIPKKGSNAARHQRAKRPYVLQPLAAFPIEDGKPLEALPLGPIIGTPNTEGSAFSATTGYGLFKLESAFRAAGAKIDRMADLMPLPDCTLVFADPDICPEDGASAKVVQSFFRTVFSERRSPLMHGMTQWVDNRGQPKQQQFFPKIA